MQGSALLSESHVGPTSQTLLLLEHCLSPQKSFNRFPTIKTGFQKIPKTVITTPCRYCPEPEQAKPSDPGSADCRVLQFDPR